MAKVFKATIFLVDANDFHESKEELINSIEKFADRADLSLHVEEVQESEEFEWDDELEINFTDAETFEYDKYLK